MQPLLQRCTILCLLLLTGGCGAFGALAFKLKGPDAVPAQYLLAGNAKENTVPPVVLVLAEDYATGSDQAIIDADRLARMVTLQMRARVKDITLVDAERAGSLRSNKPKDYPGMSVAAVGKALGADLVVHVRALRIQTLSTPGSDLNKGQASAVVRVVDVANERVVWPLTSTEGMTVGHESEYVSGRDVQGSRRTKTVTMEGLADQIAKLFYTWKPDDGIKER